MDDLRLTLSIIGCFVVLGIYLWEVFYRDVPKCKTDILDAVDEIPDMPISPLINNATGDHFSAEVELGRLLTQSRNQSLSIDDTSKAFNTSEITKSPDEPDQDLPLEMSVKDYAAIEEEIHRQDEFGRKEETDIEIPENNQSSEDLLVLYITSPTHTLFNGLSIGKAVDEVGMVYGQMNIFHHFGPGKLHSGQPLFSIANMYEPGSFDLGRMADLKTKGIAAFMYSPASIDASVVFELFLNTIQRIAELLGGELRTADNELLNNAAINSLRDKAESLSVT